MRQKPREAETEGERGRFVLRFQDGRHWCEIQNPRDFASRVGEEVISGFLKCYRGVDQIKTIEGLMKLEADNLRDVSLASERVGPALALMMISTLYEISGAIKELECLKIHERIKDPQNLARVVEIRKAWYTEKAAAIYRNQLGFHLGDADVYRSGLSKKIEESEKTLEFSRGDGWKSHDWVHGLAFDVLLAGAGIDDSSVEEILTRSLDTHPIFPELLDALWLDVLASAGVEVFKESDYPDQPVASDTV